MCSTPSSDAAPDVRRPCVQGRSTPPLGSSAPPSLRDRSREGWDAFSSFLDFGPFAPTILPHTPIWEYAGACSSDFSRQMLSVSDEQAPSMGKRLKQGGGTAWICS